MIVLIILVSFVELCKFNIICTALYQGLIDSKEKRACNQVPIKLHSKAKNSNKFYTNYGIEAANVTKNSTVLQLV